MKQKNWLKILSCSVFAGLYLIVAVISLICSTEFFNLAHSGIMSWVLAIGFEIGAMSCLLSTLILPKEKLGLVWFMFIILTLFQCMGNMYAAFINLKDYTDWIDMFSLSDLEPISQKRVLSAISGIILPLVALGFIRIMADVLQDSHDIKISDTGASEGIEEANISAEEKKRPQTSQNTPETMQTVETWEPAKPAEKPVEVKEPAKPVEKPVEVKEQVKPVEKPVEIKEPVKPVEVKEPVKPVEKPVEVKEQVKPVEKPVEAKEPSPATNAGKVWSPTLNAEIG